MNQIHIQTERMRVMKNSIWCFELGKYILEFVMVAPDGVQKIVGIVISNHKGLAEDYMMKIARQFGDGSYNIKN